MGQEHLEKTLSASLQRVIDWVKFSEAKHAVLVTLASAWCLGITTVISQHPEHPRLIAYTLQYSRACFVVALFISIFSFLPRRKLEVFYRLPPKDRNLLFYGHIATFSELADLRVAFRDRYNPSSEAFFNDLSDQIGIVSQIADRKFVLFNWSAIFFGLGIVTLAIPTARNLAQYFFGST